ncbi:EAL domain-containing protein [Ideonella sp. DXS22W]|uniref:EAL domain-containing protein n=1 Tax=Pseudaquabacterium inlustre TaxID=2984192 RepID=A0ABU9CI89_9BURK
MRRSVHEALRPQTVAQVMARQALTAHFQPIVRMRDGAVAGHESLIRGPVSSDLASPDALFRAARAEDCVVPLERMCVWVGLQQWRAHAPGTLLFVNLSASTLVELVERQPLSDLLGDAVVSPSAIVIELTEHERVADVPQLIEVANRLRALGLRFALDDFGDGRSSLRLWAELRPEIVKIDKYFIRGVDSQPVKVQTLRGLLRLAESFGTALVAEGIETEQELRVVRDLGIEYGQGYLLGRPAADPAMAVPRAVADIIASAEVAVLPELQRAASAQFTVERLALPVPGIEPDTPNDRVAALFAQDLSLKALAIVADGRPLGLLNRQSFTDRYTRPFFRELYGRKPCMLFANTTPLVLDRHTGLDAMTAVLTSADQRYLTEGFIVTEGGRYLGLGTGEQLVRVVTEVRIEAARHANPLTFLPGNIPISEHIGRLLASGGEFVACYCDLNDFKPYNDHYGYWSGDEMIRLVARTLVALCDPRRDFVGHVGGDDFVVLFQSSDWLERCEQIIATFNEGAKALFDEGARQRGGIDAEDRHGVTRFFAMTTLSVGAVPVRPGRYERVEQVATAAAAAKHLAKQARRGLAIGEG